MKPTPEQEARMRKVAFYVGVARYCHTHGVTKTAGIADDLAKLTTIGAIGIPVLSYLGGRHAGRFAGGMYGNAITPNAATLGEREYDLASAATQRMIDEINADRVNKTVSDTMEEDEKPVAKKPLFASPSLLRYGR